MKPRLRTGPSDGMAWAITALHGPLGERVSICPNARKRSAHSVLTRAVEQWKTNTHEDGSR